MSINTIRTLARESFFFGSDSQGRFGREFLSNAFPLVLGRRPPSQIRVAWRDIVGLDAETGVGHLVDKQHRLCFGLPSIAGVVFVPQPPDLVLGQIDDSEN